MNASGANDGPTRKRPRLLAAFAVLVLIGGGATAAVGSLARSKATEELRDVRKALPVMRAEKTASAATLKRQEAALQGFRVYASEMRRRGAKVVDLADELLVAEGRQAAITPRMFAAGLDRDVDAWNAYLIEWSSEWLRGDVALVELRRIIAQIPDRIPAAPASPSA